MWRSFPRVIRYCLLFSRVRLFVELIPKVNSLLFVSQPCSLALARYLSHHVHKVGNLLVCLPYLSGG